MRKLALILQQQQQQLLLLYVLISYYQNLKIKTLSPLVKVLLNSSLTVRAVCGASAL